MGIEELLNNSIVQSPLSTGGSWPILLCCVRGKGLLPFAGAHRRVGVCTRAPVQLLRALGTGGGFHLLWSLSVRQGSSPGCCAALQAEPQPSCGSEVLLPRLITGLFVALEKGQWISSASLIVCADWGKGLWSGVPGVLMKHCASLDIASTTQPTTVLELLRGRLGGILRKLEMLKSCLTFREALQ